MNEIRTLQLSASHVGRRSVSVFWPNDWLVSERRLLAVPGVILVNKSELTWLQTQVWCLQNPGKKAAIIVPSGMYVVVFTEKKEEPVFAISTTE